MSSYSVADAKNQLSRLINKALDGEEIIITRRGKPVIELRPMAGRTVTSAAADQWLFDRTRARPGVGLTSVEILDLVYDQNDD